MPLLLRSAFALFAFSVLLTGCDALEPTRAPFEDLEAAIDDAVIAREQGDYETAVELLEDAVEAHPESAPARVELGVTYLERDGIDLFELERIARRLAGENAASATVASAAPPSCSFASNRDAEPFDPSDYAEYAGLLANRASVEAARANVGAAEAAAIPGSLRAVNLCTGIEGGEIVYEREAALEAMTTAGLSDEQIGAALAVNATSLILTSVFTLLEDVGPDQNVQWYRIPNSDGSYTIGLCADDLVALQEASEGVVADMGEALVSLDLRAHHLGRTGLTQEIVDVVVEAYTEIEDDLADYCDAE